MTGNYGKSSAVSVGEAVYHSLRSAIIELRLAPGVEMSEKEIALRMEVSRTPVREAFIKLSKEALVEVLPQKGTVVSRIDLERVRQERFLRESLELAVLDRFMLVHQPDDLVQMHELIAAQRTAETAGDEERMMEYDNAFHKVLFTVADQLLSWEAIENMGGHYRRVRQLTTRTEIVKGIVKQHEQLLHAIESGEADKARDILGKHLRKLILEKDELLKNYPDFFNTRETANPFFLGFK